MKNTGRRVRAGLVVSLFFFVIRSISVEGLPVTLGSAPENNLDLTLQAIRSAKDTLLINIYEFKSEKISRAIKTAIREKVKVVILEEGQPNGGWADAAQTIQDDLVSAMGEKGAHPESQFYLMRNYDDRSSRRYRFNHAKYVIADGKEVLVSSENFSDSGHPDSEKKGNRGWEALVQDDQVVSQFKNFFRTDIDTQFGDVAALVSHERFPQLLVHWASAGLSELISEPPVAPEVAPVVASALVRTEVDSVQVISSPETSLRGLVALLGSARKSIDLELMSINDRWGNTGKTSPLFEAIVEAARRSGVKVRVLLNDERVFGGKTGPNVRTIDRLNELAREEGLKLEARTCDIRAMGITYIHNKGALVDQDKVLVSSINWNQNSVENNRETAVVLNGSAAYDYYGPLFERDWRKSEQGSRK